MSLTLGKAVDKLSDNLIQDSNSNQSDQENKGSDSAMFKWLNFKEMKDLLQEEITERQV